MFWQLQPVEARPRTDLTNSALALKNLINDGKTRHPEAYYRIRIGE